MPFKQGVLRDVAMIMQHVLPEKRREGKHGDVKAHKWSF
jgi:hypothetical protein